MIEIGRIEKISIKTDLVDTDKKIIIRYEDLSRDLKKEFEIFKKEHEEKSRCLDKFLIGSKSFFIKRDDYLRILNLKDSTVYNRSLDNTLYFKYLIKALTIKELKKLCKEYELKGYSSLGKKSLTDFLGDSLSKEEILDYLKEAELSIISQNIAKGLSIINKKGKETIEDIKIINSNLHEIEITYKGFNWETKNSLTINRENINDPDRYCDCIIGGDGGFCPHFWIGFIYSLKKNYFTISNWRLTILPTNFKRMVLGVNFKNFDN